MLFFNARFSAFISRSSFFKVVLSRSNSLADLCSASFTALLTVIVIFAFSNSWVSFWVLKLVFDMVASNLEEASCVCNQEYDKLGLSLDIEWKWKLRGLENTEQSELDRVSRFWFLRFRVRSSVEVWETRLNKDFSRKVRVKPRVRSSFWLYHSEPEMSFLDIFRLKTGRKSKGRKQFFPWARKLKI